MPHFAHRRVESGSGEERSLDLHHWNDSTGELYQASIGQVSSSASSTSSVPSITKKSDLSPDDLDNLLYGDDQPAMVEKHRKRAARETDLQFDTAAERRSYFGNAEHRQAIQFGPEVCGLPEIVHALPIKLCLQDVILTDFCYGFLDFNPTIALRLPGGLSFDLMRYWDGQPVKFVCCERKKEEGLGEPWGRVFWCVVIERAD